MNLRNGTRKLRGGRKQVEGGILVGEVGFDGVDDLAGPAPAVTTFGQKHSKLVLLSRVLLPW
jgi:hypothetical protein